MACGEGLTDVGLYTDGGSSCGNSANYVAYNPDSAMNTTGMNIDEARTSACQYIAEDVNQTAHCVSCWIA